MYVLYMYSYYIQYIEIGGKPPTNNDILRPVFSFVFFLVVAMFYSYIACVHIYIYMY